MSTDKKYPNGTLYKIWSHINDCFYIGSTFRPLRCRKSQHKSTPHCEKIRQWFEDVGWENLKFEEIATYKDITKRELNKYEDEEILKQKRNDNCMNTVRAYLTDDEKKQQVKQYYQDNEEGLKERRRNRYQDNREQELEQKKKYRENNKEKLTEYDKKRYNSDTKREYNKRYYHENKKKILEQKKEYYNLTKEQQNSC